LSKFQQLKKKKILNFAHEMGAGERWLQPRGTVLDHWRTTERTGERKFVMSTVRRWTLRNVPAGLREGK